MRTPTITLAALSLAALLGCATPDSSAVETPDLPTQQGFPYVAQLMEHECGTLDCHGSVYRNLRVYGDEGLRYSPSDRPCVPAQTTTAEVGQDYASIVGLEPEELSAVVAAGGADPQSLTLLAKPLGIESHKGGTLFQVGDSSYTCLASWLAGQTSTEACLAALPPTMCAVPSQLSFDAGTD